MGETIQGIVGVVNYTNFANGMLNTCTVDEKNVLKTSVGDLVPRYRPPDFRTKNLKSLSFYDDGALRSVSLDEQTTVMTPLGLFPAELVTFYRNGVLNSIFPLNGQIGSTWSEEEEGSLTQVYPFEFTFGSIEVRLNGMRFYQDGSLKSILFWPGETAMIETPLGSLPGQNGIRLFDDGSLQSFEPAIPLMLETPVGPVPAYDAVAVGIDADVNSVCFDRDGRLTQLKTSGKLVITDERGERTTISSQTRFAMTEDVLIYLPLTLVFGEREVRIEDGVDSFTVPFEGHSFEVSSSIDLSGLGCAGECSACAGCS